MPFLFTCKPFFIKCYLALDKCFSYVSNLLLQNTCIHVYVNIEEGRADRLKYLLRLRENQADQLQTKSKQLIWKVYKKNRLQEYMHKNIRLIEQTYRRRELRACHTKKTSCEPLPSQSWSESDIRTLGRSILFQVTRSIYHETVMVFSFSPCQQHGLSFIAWKELKGEFLKPNYRFVLS